MLSKTVGGVTALCRVVLASLAVWAEQDGHQPIALQRDCCPPPHDFYTANGF